MTTQVISTAVSYITDSSFKSQVFIATEDVLRPKKKFDKGFFMFKDQLLAVLHNHVAGFSMLPQSVPLKQLWQILKGAAIVVSVDTYDEGEELPGDDSDVADEVTYYTTVKSIVLSDEGQNMLQKLFKLGMFSSMGMEKYAVKMIEQMAASVGGQIVVENSDEGNDAPTDAGDADDADDADDVPAWKKAATDVATLSAADKSRRTRWTKAGNALV